MLVTMLIKWVAMWIIQHFTLLVKKSVSRVLLYTISYFVLLANGQLLQVMLCRKTGYVIVFSLILATLLYIYFELKLKYVIITR
jgi:hypothetical protein